MLTRFVPTAQLSYAALLGSLATLWRQHPGLRRAATAQGLLSLGFSAFWSTLAVMLHGAPFHLGAGAAGAFGLAGAAGAVDTGPNCAIPKSGWDDTISLAERIME